jgi:CubicO group peptidase (beta-lactamase class C family)
LDIDPKAAGMSAQRLERLTAHLENQYLQPEKIAGCQVLVARRGKIAYFRSLGFADLADRRPIEDDTLFRIYSMTKPITSIALMQLYERGLFQLNDPISRVIPGWRRPNVFLGLSDHGELQVEPATSEITFRQILSHTAGLSYGNGNHPVDKLYAAAGLNDRRQSHLASFVEVLAEIPLYYHPGQAWLYSYATDVCGYLVEALSGMAFGDYLKTYVFEPLGMIDTGFYVPTEKVFRLASNYERQSDKTLQRIDAAETSTYLEPPTFESGGGGLVSTTKDYFNFCQMLLQDGQLEGERIVSRRTLGLMRQNHLRQGRDLTQMAIGSFSETAYEGIGFGLGFAMNLNEVASGQIGVDDFYWGGAASTIFSVDPREDLVILFMTQLMPSSTFNFRGQIKNIVYGAIDD